MGRKLKVINTAVGNYLTGVVIDEDLLKARHPGANVERLLRMGGVVVTNEPVTETGDLNDLAASVTGELRGPSGPLASIQDDPNAGAPLPPTANDLKAADEAIAEHEEGQDNAAYSTNAVHDPFRDRNVPLGAEPVPLPQESGTHEFSDPENGPEVIEGNPNDELPPVTGVREVEIAPSKPVTEPDKASTGSTRPDKGNKKSGGGK